MQRYNNSKPRPVLLNDNRPLVALVEFNLFKTNWYTLSMDLQLNLGEKVVVQDDDGEDLGRVVALEPMREQAIEGEILRRATEDDVKSHAELDLKTKQALELFRQMRAEYNLNMQVIGAHWRLDRKKICFYFIAEEKLNFRLLHRAVASALNVRVAIKQIGVRDHTRLLGGLGVCGRETCCKQFLKELKPITLRMARLQNLFVEPSKISGLCGKLLCCLSYEDDVYQQMITSFPHIGDTVKTKDGAARVTEVNVLTRRVRLRFDNGVEQAISLEELQIE